MSTISCTCLSLDFSRASTAFVTVWRRDCEEVSVMMLITDSTEPRRRKVGRTAGGAGWLYGGVLINAPEASAVNEG